MVGVVLVKDDIFKPMREASVFLVFQVKRRSQGPEVKLPFNLYWCEECKSTNYNCHHRW